MARKLDDIVAQVIAKAGGAEGLKDILAAVDVDAVMERGFVCGTPQIMARLMGES